MTEQIVIKTVFDYRESQERLKKDLTATLNSPEVTSKAKEAGRRMGEAVGAGIETRRRGREEKEAAHARRMEAIATQSNARLVQIDARRQAQIDVIRERAAQAEIGRLKRLESQAVTS